MKNLHKDIVKPDKKLTAVCGLFCASCTVYIGNQEDPERLKIMAERLNCSTEELICEGCRSDKLALHCRNCSFKLCTKKKEVDFCGDCSEFPCDELKNFQKQLPHRIELWDYQHRIKKVGFEKWFIEMNEHYACSKCGTLNSAYDLQCRSCNNDPSCEYVKLHEEKIMDYIIKNK